MKIQLKKSVGKIFLSILLIILVFSFVWSQIFYFFFKKNNEDIITFSGIKNISKKEFLMSKNFKITTLQNSSDHVLTDAELEQLDINQQVLDELVVKRMLLYLGKYFMLDISNEKVIEFIQKYPPFLNDRNKFELSFFTGYLHKIGINEKDFFDMIKENQIIDFFFQIFGRLIVVPEDVFYNYSLSFSSSRLVDIISVKVNQDLFQDFQYSNPTEDQMKTFFKIHKDEFFVPEKRSFSYIILNPYLHKKPNTKISEQKLLKYFKDNNDLFKGRKYNKDLKFEIQKLIQKEIFEEVKISMIKELEMSILENKNLDFFAKKYQTQTFNVNNSSLEELRSSPSVLLQTLSGEIFDLFKGQISYPIEVNSASNKDQDDRIVLLQVNSIYESYRQEFEDVKNNIEKLWKEHQRLSFNLNKIKSITLDYSKDTNLSKKFTITQNVDFSKVKTAPEILQKYPIELIRNIFQVNHKFLTTDIVKSGDYVYFAYVKDIIIDKKKVQEINNDHLRQNITYSIQNMLLEDLIMNLAQEHKIQRKYFE